MEILGPLPNTLHGSQLVLVMTDGYTNPKRAVPMYNKPALHTKSLRIHNWVVSYGSLELFLTDIEIQFIHKFFESLFAFFGTKHRKTMVYHLQTNGQAERLNMAIIIWLQHYGAEHQRSWGIFVQLLTYAYRAQLIDCRVDRHFVWCYQATLLDL